jgi:hypothetical protein
MTVLNRLLLAFLALFLLGVGIALLAAPQATLSLADQGLAALRGTSTTLLWTAGILIAVGLILLITERWPQRRPQAFMARIDGGTVEYSREAIARALEQDMLTLPGVRDAQVVVGGSRGKVDAHLRLMTAHGIDPQGIAVQAAGRARDRLERGLGLRLRDFRLSVLPGEAEPVVTERREHPAA